MGFDNNFDPISNICETPLDNSTETPVKKSLAYVVRDKSI